MKSPAPKNPYALSSYTEAERRAAFEAVADDWAQLARDIRRGDAYASHVTEAEKDGFRDAMLASAERIRAGEVTSLTILQRLIEKLSGDCVALLP